jgi:HPt (histidine-containing phosphotransfer) domain-containing protein
VSDPIFPSAAGRSRPAGDLAVPPEMREALAFVHRIGGEELIERVVTLFRTSSEERLVALRAALASSDRQAVRRLAHALKGSAAQVGAEGLRGAAASVEASAAELPSDALAAEIEALAGLAAVSRELLEQEKSRAGRSA